MPQQPWRPRLDDAGRGYYSAAGDTSEGSTAGQGLMSIDEMSHLDEESLREIQDGVTRALAARGGGRKAA